MSACDVQGLPPRRLRAGNSSDPASRRLLSRASFLVQDDDGHAAGAGVEVHAFIDAASGQCVPGDAELPFLDPETEDQHKVGHACLAQGQPQHLDLPQCWALAAMYLSFAMLMTVFSSLNFLRVAAFN